MAAETTEKKAKKPKRSKKELALQEQQQEAQKQRFPKIVKRRAQMPKGEHGGMRLLLVENVPDLGRAGDVVEVKPGYGRNYLVPQGLATDVTPRALVQMDKHKAKVEAMQMAKLADLKLAAKKLEAHSITIEANANEEGHLYGSVTAVDIVASLREEGFPLAESNIRLEGPLKELGLYQVAIHLHEEVDTELKVWVVPAGGKNETD